MLPNGIKLWVTLKQEFRMLFVELKWYEFSEALVPGLLYTWSFVYACVCVYVCVCVSECVCVCVCVCAAVDCVLLIASVQLFIVWVQLLTGITLLHIHTQHPHNHMWCGRHRYNWVGVNGGENVQL